MRCRAWVYGIMAIAMLCVAGRGLAQPACSSTNDNSCEVYSECIEKNCKCEATQFKYPQSFGLKYCKRFGESLELTSNGQKWRDKTLSCLKDRISAAYVANSQNGCDCGKIQQLAIASHTDCYISDPSFCSLSDDDVRAIARIVDLEDVGALGRTGLTETARTLFGCFQTAGFDRGTKIAVTFGDETLNEGADRVRDYLVGVMEAGSRIAEDAGMTKVADAFRQLVERYRKKLP